MHASSSLTEKEVTNVRIGCFSLVVELEADNNARKAEAAERRLKGIPAFVGVCLGDFITQVSNWFQIKCVGQQANWEGPRKILKKNFRKM
jgi:hypothetical protein